MWGVVSQRLTLCQTGKGFIFYYTVKNNQRLWPLTLGALGVVFGDIGTSPLYTIQECIHPVHGIATDNSANLFGVASLIFWALFIVVSVKYILVLMKADNRGEGGIFALLALLPENLKVPYPGKLGFMAVLVIIGAALLFGDGMITPAISVLSAMEGLRVIAPGLNDFVLPLTVSILFGLFWVQKKGSGKIGAWFGPVMIIWFSVIGLLGLRQVVQTPFILKALSPVYAIQFFADNGWHGFRLLGAVVLAITGGEAMYADMGHFGKKPIRVAWFAIVFPCLLLNYLGQAAFLVQNPTAVQNTFYNLVPAFMNIPMLILATFATIIASQAMISGAFSLTHQAVRLGYFPRVTVKHTSNEQEGNIYVPLINWTIAAACIALVLMFKSSSALASAYGLAVTGQMIIASIVFYAVTRYRWNWNPILSFGILVLFLTFDIPFLLANSVKFFDGGYVPVFIGFFFFMMMLIWKQGRSLLHRHFMTNSPPLDKFLEHLEKRVSYRIPGTAVFMASASKGVPPVVLRMVKRFHVLHKTVVLLTVTSEDVPYIRTEGDDGCRIDVEDMGKGFYRVIVRYGFMEEPNIPAIMSKAFEKLNMHYWERDLLYILGHETFVDHHGGSLPPFRQAIFALLSRNARNATDYFRLPPDQVIELGTQIDL